MADNMRELLEEADKRFSEWHLDDAARLYEEAVDRQPNFRYAINKLARCYAMQGQIKRLVRTCIGWQKYLADNNYIDIAGEVAKAILCFEPGSVDGRVCMLRLIKDTEGEEQYFAALHETINYFIEIDECELAIKVLRNAQESYPTNIDIAVKLADVLMAEGEIDSAINAYRKIIGELESSAEVLRAAEVYRRLEVLTPNDMSVIMRLAEIYFDNEMYVEAASEYRNALRVEYSNHQALDGLGSSLMKQGDNNGAILAFRKAIVLEPDNTDVRKLLAQAYIEVGNVDDAVKELLGAGANLVTCEDYAEAQTVYEKILEVCPDHPIAVRELSNVKDALNRQKAREEQIRKLQNGGIQALRAEAAKKEAEAKVAASSANVENDGIDPYAGGTDIYGGDDLYGAVPAQLDGELGAPGSGDDMQLGAMSDAASSTAASSAASSGPQVTRVLASTGDTSGIYKPVPFVVARYPDMVPLIQQLISVVPSQDIFGWNYLAQLDTEAMAGKAEVEKEEVLEAPPLLADVVTTPADGGGVSSAFCEGASCFFDSHSAPSKKEGGLFGGSSFGVKSRFSKSEPETKADNTADTASLSLVERIQMQQKQRRR